MPQEQLPNDESLNNSQGSSLSSNSSMRNFNFNRDLIFNRENRENSINLNSPINNNNNIIINNEINPNNDEEFYNPNQPYLFPIELPHQVSFENTLDVLLRSVTGRNDLENVQSLKLRVISASVSLYRLSLYMPNLTSLNLEGSVLCSLRDLGYDLINLTFLNISNCGLTSLDGTGGLASVEALIADKNMIQMIGPIQNLIILKKLSLRDNHITNMNLLTFLGACSLLEEVDLRDNLVTKDPSYRSTLKQTIPSLNYLDGSVIRSELDEKIENTSISTDNEIYSPSSLSEDISVNESLKTDLNNSIDIIEIRQRPSTSNGLCRSKVSNIDIKKRPATAISQEFQNHRRTLTSGPPLCGSITNLIRRKKNGTKIREMGAWERFSTDESSSSSLYSENHKEISITSTLSKQLPHINSLDLSEELSMDDENQIKDSTTKYDNTNK